MRLDFWYWKGNKDTVRETHKEKNRRVLTCVWLTVGMRECKGMITNRSETQQDKKRKTQTKRFLPTQDTTASAWGCTSMSQNMTLSIINIQNATIYQHWLHFDMTTWLNKSQRWPQTKQFIFKTSNTFKDPLQSWLLFYKNTLLGITIYFWCVFLQKNNKITFTLWLRR